jgi:hypothetical protein
VIVPELAGGTYVEVAAVVLIYNGSKNAWRVESREAEPV